jgi:hypothetical protein
MPKLAKETADRIAGLAHVFHINSLFAEHEREELSKNIGDEAYEAAATELIRQYEFLAAEARTALAKHYGIVLPDADIGDTRRRIVEYKAARATMLASIRARDEH